MKKSLVLAMAMALGVTASAYAANPFTDVPAGHWAYDSISKLAAAGVIEGYGDDTFRGDRLMTRYEMAQIVAKAMAKGANIDKLAAEFADELDALGVRVAALEKKSDNVKITGQVRYHYSNVRGTAPYYGHQLRTRLNFNGKVNDNWSYFARLENRSNLTDNVGNERTDFQQAHVYGRLGGVNVTAGRFNLTRSPNGDIYDDRFDGIMISYGSKIKLEAYYGKTATWRWQNGLGTQAQRTGYDHAWGINASGKIGKNVKLYAGYDHFKDKDGIGNLAGTPRTKNGIFDVGANFKFGDFALDAVYLHSNSDEAAHKNGFVATLGYKGANFKKAGSWGLEAKYYNQGDGTFIAHTMNGDIPNVGGFKGYKLAGYYTLAKNMMAGIEYFDLKAKDNNNKARTLWTELQIRF